VSKTTHAKVVIIGSGPAGYTAAIYAARAMLDPIMIQGIQAGGQLTTTTDVENYPGFADVIQGPWLMEQMEKQAAHVGTKMVPDHVNKVDLSRRPFRIECDSGEVYVAETLILATGAQARWLDLPSEQKFRGYGVSACATCDGFFFRGHRVAVVGGGNTAVEETLYLSNLAEHVTLIHRRDKLRAEKILQDRLMERVRAGKVSLLWHHHVEEILGDESGVHSIRVRSTVNAGARDIAVSGIFIAIGHTPNTELFRGQLAMHGGYLTVHGGSEGNATATSVPGVFAAGDVADHVYRQAITSAGSGCMAALDADRYLEQFDHVTTAPLKETAR
jgi:thioredoxin reductase (NADPH)